jgi:hypothetical protein
MEQHYAFLKENRVVNVAVFASEDKQLAAQIAAETGCDSAIWVGPDKPALHSLWNGTAFEEPTTEYLVSIGVLAAQALAQPEMPAE